ncbi:MAG: DUF4363 family protein [Clostridia bacterium]|nr:DUF4363 family protein [Clostridia bacterium]
MKRIFFAIGALLSAILICTVGYFVLVDTCDKLETTLNEVVYFAENDDTENALKKAQEVADQWEEIHGRIEAVVNHAETDELEEVIKSLPVYARLGDTERLCEKTEIAINRLHHIVKNEKVLISNIL